MNKFYTYAFLREDGTPYYIGKGKGGRAYYNTGRTIKKPKDKDRILFLKQNLTEEEAFKHEKYMIAVLGRIDLGTGILRNLTEGGEGTSGRIYSEETKRKISNSLIGKPLSEEHKKKISKIHKGRITSEETRKKMSTAQRGRTVSDETKKKLSELARNRQPVSEETKKRISDSNKGEKNGMYGKNHSEETRKKISESKSGKHYFKKPPES